jgi:hypothetical protein
MAPSAFALLMLVYEEPAPPAQWRIFRGASYSGITNTKKSVPIRSG